MKRLSNHVDSKPFAELFNSPADFNLVFSSLEHTIMASFAIDAKVLGRKPEITQEKVKSRFKICEKWFRIMRGELGYSLRRTIDTIPKALACELLDQPFDPAANNGHGYARIDMDKEVSRVTGK